MTRFDETEIPGVIVIEPQVHRDERGFFLEAYPEPRYHDAGIRVQFVQDNHSQSTRGTLRGRRHCLGPPPRARSTSRWTWPSRSPEPASS